MRIVLSTYIILQLLYLHSRVVSLNGPKVIPARYGEFPYVASLQRYPNGDKFCTGTLVSKKHVITVAHCIENKTIGEVRIVFEVASLPETFTEYALNFWLTYDTWAEVRGIKKDPGTHDIAVIELKEKVNQRNVKPILLSPSHYKQMKGKKAVATGWLGHDLLKAFVKNLSKEDCQNNIRLITDQRIEIDSRVLCTAAVPPILLDKGDGGAPMVDEHKTLLGLSIGLAPALKHAFHNYSNEFLQRYQVNLHVSVDYYWNFIVSNTQ